MKKTVSQVSRPVTCSWVPFLWRVYRRLQLISPTVTGPSSCKQKNTSLYKPPSSLYWSEFDFCDLLKPKKAIECKMYFDQHCHVTCSLRASSPGRSGGGAGKGKRACNFATTSLEFKFHLQFPCDSLSTELSYFRQSARSGN